MTIESSKNEADKPTTNESNREITANELNKVVGGAIQWTYTKQKPDGTAGGDLGPAISAWNTLLHQYGAA